MSLARKVLGKRVIRDERDLVDAARGRELADVYVEFSINAPYRPSLQFDSTIQVTYRGLHLSLPFTLMAYSEAYDYFKPVGNDGNGEHLLRWEDRQELLRAYVREHRTIDALRSAGCLKGMRFCGSEVGEQVDKLVIPDASGKPEEVQIFGRA